MVDAVLLPLIDRVTDEDYVNQTLTWLVSNHLVCCLSTLLDRWILACGDFMIDLLSRRGVMLLFMHHMCIVIEETLAKRKIGAMPMGMFHLILILLVYLSLFVFHPAQHPFRFFIQGLERWCIMCVMPSVPIVWKRHAAPVAIWLPVL